MKVDKQGNFVWAKNIGGAENESCNSIAYKNGAVYFVGYTTELDGSGDILFSKLAPDGGFTGASCNYVEDLQVTTSTIANPYNGNKNLAVYSSNFLPLSANIPVLQSATPMTEVQGCGCLSDNSDCNNLILNPGFENDFNDWTVTGEATLSDDAQSGSNAAFICSTTPSSIGQLFPTQEGLRLIHKSY